MMGVPDCSVVLIERPISRAPDDVLAAQADQTLAVPRRVIKSRSGHAHATDARQSALAIQKVQRSRSINGPAIGAAAASASA